MPIAGLLQERGIDSFSIDLRSSVPDNGTTPRFCA